MFAPIQDNKHISLIWLGQKEATGSIASEWMHKLGFTVFDQQNVVENFSESVFINGIERKIDCIDLSLLSQNARDMSYRAHTKELFAFVVVFDSQKRDSFEYATAILLPEIKQISPQAPILLLNAKTNISGKKPVQRMEWEDVVLKTDNIRYVSINKDPSLAMLKLMHMALHLLIPNLEKSIIATAEKTQLFIDQARHSARDLHHNKLSPHIIENSIQQLGNGILSAPAIWEVFKSSLESNGFFAAPNHKDLLHFNVNATALSKSTVDVRYEVKKEKEGCSIT